MLGRASLGVVVAALWLSSAGPVLADQEVFQRTYPLASGGSFELHNVNGSVQVEGWNREEVQIHATKESRANPADESRVKIEVEATPTAVRVHTRYPREGGLDVTVDYHVRVPARLLTARISTVNGHIRVWGIESSGELRTVNGDIEVLDGAGLLSARTTNGNVHLELGHLGSMAAGAMSVESVNGSVLLALAPGASAELEIQSLNGDFTSELPLVLSSSRSPQWIHGRLGDGGAAVRLRTVNGGIRIVMARATV